jgi:K+-sensing histidine kinase KdpD
LLNRSFQRSVFYYSLAVTSIAAVTALLAPFHQSINSTTIALALLLVVLFVATQLGSGPALLASLAGIVSFNFFFLPPVRTLIITEPENWVALVAFLITAVTAGELSGRVRRRAAEAEAGRREIERLYEDLSSAFERASHAEALRQSEKLKSALLDAVSHDIRTPLTSIKASVTTLLDEVRGGTAGEPSVMLDTESRTEMLEIIDEESDRLDKFVEGLIELARIEAGEMQLRPGWGPVDEIITSALGRAKLRTLGHLVEVRIDKNLPVAQVDPRSIEEVIYTLVDNAAKYSAVGTRILIDAKQTADEAIQISVEDEGQGVPADLRERVFDKFFRATQDGDLSSAGSKSGTGMGLSIARGIVEAHGGRIWLGDGSNGKGTRVTFTLPIGDEEDNGSPLGEQNI